MKKTLSAVAVAIGLTFTMALYTYSPVHIVTITPSHDVYQVVRDIPPNSKAVIHVTEGVYGIGTNATSLLRNGLTWDFARGVRWQIGSASDFDPAVPFNDWSGAVTCAIMGHAEFYFTNSGGSSALLWMTNKDSNVRWECEVAYSAGGNPTIVQEGGRLIYTAYDRTESDSYDAFLSGGYGTNGPITSAYSRRWIAPGNSAIETVQCNNAGDQVFTGEYSEGQVNAVDNVLIKIAFMKLANLYPLYGGTTNEIYRHNAINFWFTNVALSGQTFTLDGRTVTWTNDTPLNTNFILTGGSPALTATALTNYIALNPFTNVLSVHRLNNTNVVVLSYTRRAGEGAPEVFGSGSASVGWRVFNATNSTFHVGSGVVEGATIFAPTNSVLPVVGSVDGFGTALTLRNCRIVGPWLGDPIVAKPMSGNLTLDNCSVICGPLATNWARPSSVGACNVRIFGSLTTRLTNHASITTIGASYTTNATATY